MSVGNIWKYFFQITNLAYDFAMIKYVQVEDIIKLAENLLLRWDLANWEKYCIERRPVRTGGRNSLSQSVLQNALQLSMDPSTSMIERKDNDGLITEEDKAIENTKF